MMNYSLALHKRRVFNVLLTLQYIRRNVQEKKKKKSTGQQLAVRIMLLSAAFRKQNNYKFNSVPYKGLNVVGRRIKRNENQLRTIVDFGSRPCSTVATLAGETCSWLQSSFYSSEATERHAPAAIGQLGRRNHTKSSLTLLALRNAHPNVLATIKVIVKGCLTLYLKTESVTGEFQ